VKCNRSLVADANFYSCESSPLFPDGRFHMCRKCLNDLFETDSGYSILMMALHAMNKPYLQDVMDKAKTFGVYISQLNSLPQFRGLDWSSSDIAIVKSPDAAKEKESGQDDGYEIIDKQGSDNPYGQDYKDVLRMIGFDPFEYEHEDDKIQLYSKLVNFLDESTLEDGFKLQATIEIVTGFNQIDKINRAITNITNDPSKMANNSGGIKTLTATKKDILTTLVKLAEENGISVKHNSQKSKGAGTLSGIIKTLHEKGIDEGELNLFNVETAEGMRQVADISNQSIIKQLQFDENEYTQMILEQREMIQELEGKSSKFEEENRILKVQLKEYRDDENEVV
jgi:hypothetical protein